jgi:glyoxylase-like metal-dependent hydrolase (beta-lactamase superfamily II)
MTITHLHPEHGLGAQAFKGAATIIYNRDQRDELRRWRAISPPGGGIVLRERAYR